MNPHFLTAGADWADKSEIDVIFLRDDNDWTACIRCSDTDGPFCVYVAMMDRCSGEHVADFRQRVFRNLSDALRAKREERARRFGSPAGLNTIADKKRVQRTVALARLKQKETI